jgi:hypothetical protein
MRKSERERWWMVLPGGFMYKNLASKAAFLNAKIGEELGHLI